MKVNEKMKKLLSILLCLCMLVQNCPVVAFAAATDNLCDHHTEHTADCGYSEGSAGSDCTHKHSEDCYRIVACKHTHDDSCSSGCSHNCTVKSGCVTMELDCRHTHGDCGYAEAVEAQDCTTCQPVLVHAENCGYVAPVAEETCACVPGEDGTVTHTEGCGYVAPVEEVKCKCEPTVTHGGEGCTYAEGKAGSPCTHTHAVKVDSADSCYKLLCSHKDGGHDDTCGYVAAVKAHECHYECAECANNELSSRTSPQTGVAIPEGDAEDQEIATELVCDCGTDDPAIHATTCAVYVAPENPVCYCAEKCSDTNEWCDVCGFDYTKCGGTDTAAVYADEWFAVNGTTVTIDGTLGGETATEEHINALLTAIKGYVDDGITTIIVTGSEPAMYASNMGNIPAYAEALWHLAGGSQQSSYCGTIDLILPDATEIVDYAFESAYGLKSITLPKVTTVGNGVFYGCLYLQTITFGSVVTVINQNEYKAFDYVGSKVDGCDLVLNCGQLQAEDTYKPDLENNVWGGGVTWKSITLTHAEVTAATCTSPATCSVCGESYGEKLGHDYVTTYEYYYALKHKIIKTCTRDETHAIEPEYENHTAGENGYCVCDAFTVTLDFNGGKIRQNSPDPGTTDKEWQTGMQEMFGSLNATSMDTFEAEPLQVPVDEEVLANLNLYLVYEGYQFVGYAYDAANTQPYKGEEITAPTTLYMVWEKAHECSHDHYNITDTTHQSVCSCGKTIGEAMAHSYGEGEVTTDPTCTEAGEKTFTCDTCDYTYTESVDALGHDYVTTYEYVYEREHDTIKTCANDSNHVVRTTELHVAGEDGYCVCGAFAITTDFNGAKLRLTSPYPGDMTDIEWQENVESTYGSLDAASETLFTEVPQIITVDEDVLEHWNLILVYEGYQCVDYAYDKEGTRLYDDEEIAGPTTLYLVWEEHHVCAHDHYETTDTTHQSVCSCGEPIGETVAHTFNSATGKCVCGYEMAEASVTMGGAATYYETLDDAISAVSGATDADNATVKLLKSVDQAERINSGVFTLDLNGKTLGSETVDSALQISGGTVTVTITDSLGGGGITGVSHGVFAEGGTLTITDATITATGEDGYGVEAYGSTLTITNATITATGEAGIGVCVHNCGEVTIEGGEIRGASLGVNAYGGTLTIKNVAITATAAYGVMTSNCNQVTIEGGEISGGSSGVYTSVADATGDTLTITNATITANGEYGYGVYAYNYDEVTIEDGEISGAFRGVDATGGTLEIQKTKITAAGADGTGVSASNCDIVTIVGGEISGGSYGVNAYGGTLTITDATITATGETSYGVSASSCNQITIEGGKISGVSRGVYADGDTLEIRKTEITAAGEYGYGVAVYGGTLTITNATITATGANGYGVYAQNCDKVTIEDGKISGDSRGVNATGGTLTITDATITATGTNGYGVEAYVGTLTITNATVTATGDGYGVYASDGDTLTITNATVTANGESGYGVRAYNCDKVTIEGGKISGEIDIECQDSTVTLQLGEDGTGTTFPGGIYVSGTALAAMLGQGAAYWQDGKQIIPTAGQTAITGGDVTVKAICDHSGNTNKPTYTDNDTHTVTYSCCGVAVTGSHTLALTYVNLEAEGHKAYYPCCQSAADVEVSSHEYEGGICGCEDVEEFTLSFYAEYGDEPPVATFSVPYGTQLTLWESDEDDNYTFLGATDYLENLISRIDSTSLTKAHYTFTGWDVENGPERMYREESIYGIWTPVSYKITWDLAGGYAEDPDMLHNEKPYGDGFMLWTDFYKEGHTFSHFVDQTGLKYTRAWNSDHWSLSQLMPGYDVTLTAVWTVNSYTLHTQDQSLDVGYGTALADALSGIAPEKTGYTFTGWKFYQDEGCTEEYTGTTMPAYVIYAQPQFEAVVYNITWDMAGCTYELYHPNELPAKLAYNVDGEDHQVDFAWIEAPAGYELVGFVDGNGNSLNMDGDTGSALYTHRLYIQVPGDMTVKAVIEPKTYMASWETGDGGIFTMDFKFGEVITIPTSESFQETFTKSGYSLTGWEGFTEGMTMPVGGVTFTATWQINPASLDSSSGVYTGQAHTPTVTVEGLREDEDFTVEYPEDMVNVGEKIITVTGKLGGTTTVTYTIEKADPTVTAPTSNTLTYSGEAQTLVTAGTANGGTLQYALYESNTTAPTDGWNDEVPAGIDADTYYVWYRVVGDSNHNNVAAASVTVTIAKAAASDAMKTASGILYENGTTTVALPELPSINMAHGTSAFAAPVASAKVVDGILSIEGGEDVVEGNTYTVTVPVAGGKNYEDYVVTVTLTGKEHVHVWTYTASGDTVTATCTGEIGTCPHKTVTYRLVIPTGLAFDSPGITKVASCEITPADASGAADVVFSYVSKSDNAQLDSYGRPDNAGDYEVTMLVDNAATVSGKLTIAPAQIGQPSSYIEEGVYSGKAHTPGPNIRYCRETFDYTVTYPDDMTNVGTRTITVTGIGNYTGSYELDYTITAKEVTITGAEIQAVTYDPNGYTLTVTDVTFDGVVEDETIDFTAVATLGNTNAAGEQAATVTVKLNEAVKNYTLGENTAFVGTVTIKPKTLTVAWENLNLVYTGEAQTPSVKSLAGVFAGDTVSAVVTGSRTDVGSSTATVALAGEDAGNYQVSAATKFTISAAPVTFTVENNTVEKGQSVNPTITSKPEIPASAFEVTYKQNGNAVTPSAVGEYEIYVKITNANYRHASTTDGSAIKIGVLSIYEEEAPKTYTLSYMNGSDTQKVENVLPGTVHVLPQPSTQNDEHGYAMLLVGWSDGTATYQPGEKYVQPEKDALLTAIWTAEEHEIDGMVQQYIDLDRAGDPENRGGVVITLMYGSSQVAQAVTDANGRYQFEHLLQGTYNLVGEYEGIKQTIKVVLGHSNETAQTIILPCGKTNTSVAVQPGTPAVVVGGLDSMMNNTNTDVYTEADKAVVEAGGEVEIEMSVKENPAPVHQVAIDTKVEENLNDTAIVEMYIDLDLTKTVRDASGNEKSSVAIAESNVLLENIIFLPGHLQGKDAYHVFREHNGSVTEMKQRSSGGSGEGFVVNSEKTTITIYSYSYSTFAIATTEFLTISFDANGGSVTPASAETNGDGKLTSLPTPTRTGYKFNGWYTAATGGEKVTSSTVFNADSTIYAKWSVADFTITVANASNGTVTVDRNKAAYGTEVTIVVTPKSGYKMATLTVKDSSGKSYAVSTDNNGKYYFTMPAADVTVTATFSKISSSTADPTNPKTGDDFQLVLWSSMAMTSLLCIAALILGKKKYYQR